MTFVEAIEALKNGEQITRKAWEGRVSLSAHPLLEGSFLRTFHGKPPEWWKGITPEDVRSTDWIIVGRSTRFERLLRECDAYQKLREFEVD